MRLLFAFALFALAAAQPTEAHERSYALDRANATVRFAVRLFGLRFVQGGFSDLDARLQIDRERPQDADLHVTIRADSVYAAGAGDAVRRMFEPDRYPLIRFVSTHVAMESENAAHVDGLLTLRGVTRPISLEAVLGHGDPLTFVASGRFRRSAFGLQSWPWASDWVELTITAPFVAQ